MNNTCFDNIHTDYGLILLPDFDSPCSLVRTSFLMFKYHVPIANAKEDHLYHFRKNTHTGSQFPPDGRSHNPISVSEPQEPILAINPCRIAPSSD